MPQENNRNKMIIIEDTQVATELAHKNVPTFDKIINDIKEIKSIKYFEKILTYSDIPIKSKCNKYFDVKPKTTGQTCITIGAFSKIIGHEYVSGSERDFINNTHKVLLVNECAKHFTKSKTILANAALKNTYNEKNYEDFVVDKSKLTTEVVIGVGAHGLGVEKVNKEFEKIRKNCFLGDKLILIEIINETQKYLLVYFVRNYKFFEALDDLDSLGEFITQNDIIEQEKEKDFLAKKERYLANEKLGTDKPISNATSRIGQTEFKTLLKEESAAYYGESIIRCAFCDIEGEDSFDGFFTASHIAPWAKVDRISRITPGNGLLLCKNHDYLFDKHYISFDENLNFVVSKAIKKKYRDALSISGKIKIPEYLKTEERIKYLKMHYQDFLEIEKERVKQIREEE